MIFDQSDHLERNACQFVQVTGDCLKINVNCLLSRHSLIIFYTIYIFICLNEILKSIPSLHCFDKLDDYRHPENLKRECRNPP